MASKQISVDNSFLATQPIGRLLFKMAIPTITAQLVNMLYNLVDRMYIGRIPDVGALALTGIGVCLPIILAVSAFASLFGFGGAPRASIFMGKGDNKSAEKVLGTCLAGLLLVSVTLTAVLLLFGDELLLLFGASADTIEYASGYLGIYSYGTIFVQLALGLNSFITAQGFTRVSMVSVVIGAVSNIILDPIFIFALNMGVEGAALATIISQGISAAFIVGFLISRNSVLHIKAKNIRINPSFLIPCVALGFSPFIMQITESITIISFNSSLLRYGGDIAVGTMTICSSAMQLVLMPLQGLAQGAQPITGYNLGAGNTSRVRMVFKSLLICSTIFSIVTWAFMMIAPQVFAMIFTGDTELIDYSTYYIRIYMGGIFAFGVQMACQMTFVAIGKAKESALAATVRKIFLLIPLIFILPIFFDDKVMGVFAAEPVADILAATFTATLFSIRFKKALEEHASDRLKTQ